MQSETANTRLLVLVLAHLGLLLFGNIAVAQQSIQDNIRPAGQVCLAGQSCVGSTVGTASAAPAAAPQAAVTAAVEIVEAVSEVAGFDVESTYQMSCFACHGAGAAGAPKLGDADAWAPRLEAGMDTLMANVINGVNAMPPKGLCMTCTDENLRSLVDYMVNQ